MARKQSPPSLDEWIASASHGRSGPDAAWKRWPPELLAEIEEVLRRNDSGRASISVRAMCDRAKSAYDVTVTRNHLLVAMQAHFGRKGWSRP